MWSQAYWIAIGIAVTAAIAAIIAAAVIGTAIQRVSDRRRARKVAANPERVTVHDIQAKIAEELARESARLAREALVKQTREADAVALAVASNDAPTEALPAVSDDDTSAVRRVPHPRTPLRVRRYVQEPETPERSEAAR